MIKAAVVQWNHACFGVRGISKCTGSNPVHGPSPWYSGSMRALGSERSPSARGRILSTVRVYVGLPHSGQRFPNGEGTAPRNSRPPNWYKMSQSKPGAGTCLERSRLWEFVRQQEDLGWS
ncbi:hypothetical protein E2C01_024875 [Portunus trituberculatus]|uniref:Uncharacterized protein n=1 Tax=Portunus trituberculatus TaxID=210409 RepID=A0A5B7EE10_PORTR|nr:hypothetical protein [Portunus trituberculatus]